ncbi:MAG: peptidase M61, partial [Thermoanaerobaculia bacterium]
GDEVVAVDGVRATEESLKRIARDTSPGTRVTVTVFRRDRLGTHRVALGARKAGVWKIEDAENASAAAKRLARRWLGRSLSA